LTAQEGEEADEAEYFVHLPSPADRLRSAAGAGLGWISYGLARAGALGAAERTADRAIGLHRHGKGAIRALGWLSSLRGRRAGYRGQFIIEGRIKDEGRFAGKSFVATYVVAAFNDERVLELVRRFERDAIPSSLRIASGALDHEDPGAEGVLYIHGGRTYF
jgi:hypothetical protein